MTSSLAARQGLLTRAGNRLSAILDEQAVLFATQEDSNEAKDIKELHGRIRTTKATLTVEVEKVEGALIKYSSTVDELPVGTPSKEEILKRAEANIDAAQEVLDRAHAALTKLLQLTMEEAAPIDATVKAAKRPEQAIKAKTTASKTVRPEKSKPAEDNK
ncbi:hypothetical protein GCK32_008139 [Trichostrongylus colubriformis]|uniref:Uncharacterized protein n=1 Tax=Trichostrongylus colubriformis TaxID=6319 RepID=A0AAN8GFB8_TRICO